MTIIIIIALTVVFLGWLALFLPLIRQFAYKNHRRNRNRIFRQNNLNQNPEFTIRYRLFFSFLGIVGLAVLTAFLAQQGRESTTPAIAKADSSQHRNTMLVTGDHITNISGGGYSGMDSATIAELSERMIVMNKSLTTVKLKVDEVKGILQRIRKGKMYSAIILLLGGFLFYWFWKKDNKKAAVIAACLTLPISQIFDSVFSGDIHLFPDENIVVDQININQKNISDNNVEIEALSFSIGPFEPGYPIPEFSEVSLLTDSLQQTLAAKKILDIDIVGGVDVREPLNISKEIHGNNMTLSMARAEYIKSLIMDKSPIIKVDMVRTYTGGAALIRPKYTEEDHRQNRYVKVYIRFVK